MTPIDIPGLQSFDARSSPVGESPLAPLPDHRHVTAAWWRQLWRRHERITTPLRERGLKCDIEYGLSAYMVRVALPDGGFLIISPPQETGDDRPAGDPEGWIVTHHQNDQTRYELIYDSTPRDSAAPERPESRNGGSAWRMVEVIDRHLRERGLLPAPATPTCTPLPPVAHGSSPTPGHHR